MKNFNLYDSENESMTLGELKKQIEEILEYDPQFVNAQVYAEGDGVRHRMVGLVNERDRVKMTGEREYFLTLLDEGGVDHEREIRSNMTPQMQRDAEDL